MFKATVTGQKPKVSDFKNRKAEEFVYQSLMDELEKEGFFKKPGS